MNTIPARHRVDAVDKYVPKLRLCVASSRLAPMTETGLCVVPSFSQWTKNTTARCRVNTINRIVDEIESRLNQEKINCLNDVVVAVKK